MLVLPLLPALFRHKSGRRCVPLQFQTPLHGPLLRLQSTGLLHLNLCSCFRHHRSSLSLNRFPLHRLHPSHLLKLRGLSPPSLPLCPRRLPLRPLPLSAHIQEIPNVSCWPVRGRGSRGRYIFGGEDASHSRVPPSQPAGEGRGGGGLASQHRLLHRGAPTLAKDGVTERDHSRLTCLLPLRLAPPATDSSGLCAVDDPAILTPSIASRTAPAPATATAPCRPAAAARRAFLPSKATVAQQAPDRQRSHALVSS
mmetsp:Transcript_1271/g.3439  ORF Transcript_1271/g.3439 Transcript_1271/m.3439 type:complete len:254 (+) Transcript_1271:3001-3762(+)